MAGVEESARTAKGSGKKSTYNIAPLRDQQERRTAFLQICETRLLFVSCCTIITRARLRARRLSLSVSKESLAGQEQPGVQRGHGRSVWQAAPRADAFGQY